MTPKEEYDALGRAMDSLDREFTKTATSKLTTDVTEMGVRRAQLGKHNRRRLQVGFTFSGRRRVCARDVRWINAHSSFLWCVRPWEKPTEFLKRRSHAAQ